MNSHANAVHANLNHLQYCCSQPNPTTQSLNFFFFSERAYFRQNHLVVLNLLGLIFPNFRRIGRGSDERMATVKAAATAAAVLVEYFFGSA